MQKSFPIVLCVAVSFRAPGAESLDDEAEARSIETREQVDQVDACKVSEARKALPFEAELRRAADAFQVLANPNRLRVLKALQGRDRCVCDAREGLGISMSGTPHVLRELRALGAAEFRPKGKPAYHRIADPFWLQLAKGVLRFAAVKAT